MQQQIPPLTLQLVTANASAGMVTVKVPVTVKTYYTCDKIDVKNTSAIIQTKGTVSTTASKLNVVYGPQIPLDPPIVLPQANATCASNPVCSALGLRTGNCCPSDNGQYNPCCSFCILKPLCKDYAIDNTTMCCPPRTNIWNSCCGPKPYGWEDGDPAAVGEVLP